MGGVNITFTGGGTGGHLYPAIAIADALRDQAGMRIAFIGTADRLEATIVPKSGYALSTVASAPLSRKLSPQLVRTAWTNARGIVQSLRVLSRMKPDAVIATGGYVCFPVVVAARLLRAMRRIDAPIILLEPNAHPGLTNRLLSPLVDEVWGAFAGGDSRFRGKYVHTGIPVRRTLRALPDRGEALARLGLSPDCKTILAMGGSQGARSINDALASLVKSDGLPDGWQLIHVTGEHEYDRVRSAIGAERSPSALRPYLHDLSDAYAAADLIVARAGASTIGELSAIGKPAILVPYPHAADDHQRHNAQVLERSGAAIVVEDRAIIAGELRNILRHVTESDRLASLQRAAQKLRAIDPIATILARIAELTKRKTGA